MFYELKKLKFSPLFAGLLSTLMVAGATPSMSNTGHHNQNQGVSLGFGAGAKFLNTKNVSTRNNGGVFNRSGDSFSNASSPVLGIYARKYMPNFLVLPTFLGIEFNYLTDMRKTSTYANLNLTGGVVDTGFQYRERWDARAMVGAQLFCAGQLDFWAQAGLQATYFDYEGRTILVNGGQTQVFRMDNNLALSPAGGLEVRFTHPNLMSNCATDFILGWTAGYRNAFKVIGQTSATNTYDIAMSSNWSHTFGAKVMFRF
jgi:hypothetical protein